MHVIYYFLTPIRQSVQINPNDSINLREVSNRLLLTSLFNVDGCSIIYNQHDMSFNNNIRIFIGITVNVSKLLSYVSYCTHIINH